ncbi:MAG: hypothetical protein ABSC23_17420 [Bryobacteraceae bacterium]|jgi:hypothetical protein
MIERILGAIVMMVCSTLPLVGQQTTDKPPAAAVSLCAVISDAAAYDGKEIVVEGLYRMVLHGAIMMDRACPKVQVNLREAPGYTSDKRAAATLRSLTKNDQFRTVAVAFRGILHVAREGQCFGQVCASFEIATTELLSARPEDKDPGAKK